MAIISTGYSYFGKPQKAQQNLQFGQL